MSVRFSRLFLLAFALAAIGSGCTRFEHDTAYDFPNDIGTKDDHQKVAETATEIQRVSAILGQNKDFHSFPVFVVGKDTPHAMGSAYCVTDSQGRGVYMGIRRGLLRETEEMNSSGVGKSRLFLILLHEYGHCLFGRAHDTEVFSRADSVINLRTGSESQVYQTIMAIPATVMYPNAYITEVSDSLKKYYVGELFGLGRMKSLADFEKFPDLMVTSTLPPARPTEAH